MRKVFKILVLCLCVLVMPFSFAACKHEPGPPNYFSIIRSPENFRIEYTYYIRKTGCPSFQVQAIEVRDRRRAIRKLYYEAHCLHCDLLVKHESGKWHDINRTATTMFSTITWEYRRINRRVVERKTFLDRSVTVYRDRNGAILYTVDDEFNIVLRTNSGFSVTLFVIGGQVLYLT